MSIFRGKHESQARRLLAISVDDTGKPQAVSLSGRILQLVKEVEMSGEAEGIKVTGKATLNQDSNSGRELHLLNLVNSVARHVADNLRHGYYILIDDLDRHWVSSPIHKEFIAALFMSLRKFSKPPNVKCVVSLREQIYRQVPLVDRDKFHDWVCRVEWDAGTLKRMLEERIHFVFGWQSADIWGGMFPENTFYNMLTHATGRPRELIRLATLCVEEGQNHGHNRIDDHDFSAALRRFSDEKISDLASEWRPKYEALELVIRHFTGWHKEFSLDKLRDLVQYMDLEIAENEGQSGRYSWVRGYAENPKGFARCLLECGFLLIKPSRTAQPKDYEPDNPHDLTDDAWFAIHPMYAPGLSLIGA